MLLEKYGIEHYKSSPYRPQAHGAVEAANKNIKKILRKMAENHYDWASKLQYALWGYWTTAKSTNGATPLLFSLDGKRLSVRFMDQLCKRRIAKHFNKRVHPKLLRVGDLGMKQMQPNTHDPRGKFKPNWEGPILIKRMFSKGAVKLLDLEGNEFIEPINVDRLKKFYV
ncbi:uncharacterized protein LOC119371572 [Jatropha curcas]|uniref:uncharacterized protein LOC119371572 n=1 Tax=Jatropha curcas TaxID=180498 RepID=UPI00189612F9|nr:uncharacterized protein LOC119371572 [Jatropha curcas]